MNCKSLMLLFFIPLAFSQNYYADIVINAEGSELSITGITNHPELISNYSKFLAYNNGYYLLNISLSDNFSNYVYEIILPKDVTINYIKTPKFISMAYGQNLIIKGLGSNEEFKAVIQYKLAPQNNLTHYLIALMVIVAGVIFYFKFFKKKKKTGINYSALTDRQAKIMKMIMNKGEVEQKYLENFLGMPKAAVSRNVNSLIRKGLIKKEKKGVSNLLILAK
ncbi:MAG: MarR family transcriptional regulator [Candidatus Nanoarchaeia archaeon]|nr:MarR family transcriptional regulator [Candidatus Nanoarchaeia archaeon]MDD5054038.1 MarR family transcriptional regulator [Candidatus Nanoarchaeia archaeon]MDD5499456.1 MarR family transcriptional regulator [Candidatus Nanoarchaeia archaeon]